MTLPKNYRPSANPLRGLSVLEVTVLSALNSTKAKLITLLGLVPPIFAVLFAIFQPMSASQIDRITQDDVRQMFTQTFAIFYVVLFGWMTTLIMATSLIADEKRDRTLSYFLTRPLSRTELLIWKWISLEIILAMIYLIPVLSFYVAMEGGLGLNEQDLARSVEDIVNNGEVAVHAYYVLFIITSAYGAILMFIGILFDRPIIVGLMMALNLEWFSLSAHAQNIMEEFLYFQGRPEDFPFSVLESHLVYLLVIMGSLIASILAVRQMDFP
ncbi:MAG: ABC transporter permease [Candidatus Hodarchaeales archaeon]|jgi:ABC-type transport system involved in multi-copper enzyme maturation permease subunit